MSVITWQINPLPNPKESRPFTLGIETPSVSQHFIPVLYLHHINDVPATLNRVIATFADDTAVMTIGETVENSTRK
jgi:hypothetical protein